MKMYRRNVTAIEPMLEMPVTANEAVEAGTLLKVASGKVTKNAGTTKPTYFAMGSAKAGTAEKVNVVQVLADMEFEAEVVATEGANSLVVGNKVTIGADGKTLTATTTSGVAEIVAIPNGTLAATGGTVIVRFN